MDGEQQQSITIEITIEGLAQIACERAGLRWEEQNEPARERWRKLASQVLDAAWRALSD